MNFKIIEFNEIESTSKYIKENLDKLRNFDVIVADRQLSGYGRRNREWFDNSENLSFSILVKTVLSNRIGLITQLAAAAVYQTLLEFGIKTNIKWPNDIVINSKKICGILVETVLVGDVLNTVIGIGININNVMFSEDIRNKATSMTIEKGIIFSKPEVLNVLLKRINETLTQYFNETDEFLDVCREHSSLIGEFVFIEENRRVKIINIDNLGRLVVEENGKTLTFIGSEVSLNNLYNI